MLSKEEMIKKAVYDKEFRNTLLSLVKTAQPQADATGGPTQFSETVPMAEQQNMYGEQATEQNQMGATKQAQTGADEQALPPEQAAQLNQQPAEAQTPESVGANAARAFLGPEVLQAALAGDQNAIQLVAAATGHVAGSVADNFAKSQINAGVPAEAQADMVPPEGTQTAPSILSTGNSPEEQIASLICPPQQQGQPISGGEAPQQEQAPNDSNAQGPDEKKDKPKEKKPFPPADEQSKQSSDSIADAIRLLLRG